MSIKSKKQQVLSPVRGGGVTPTVPQNRDLVSFFEDNLVTNSGQFGLVLDRRQQRAAGSTHTAPRRAVAPRPARCRPQLYTLRPHTFSTLTATLSALTATLSTLTAHVYPRRTRIRARIMSRRSLSHTRVATTLHKRLCTSGYLFQASPPLRPRTSLAARTCSYLLLHPLRRQQSEEWRRRCAHHRWWRQAARQKRRSWRVRGQSRCSSRMGACDQTRRVHVPRAAHTRRC